MSEHKRFIELVQSIYGTKEFIPLHEPRFLGDERKFVNEAIDSTFVSSVGKFVDQFEYKSFRPELINRHFDLNDPDLNLLLSICQCDYIATIYLF